MNIINNIKELLENKEAKISTAESCTSGYISNLLTSISGSSNYFEGSLIVYSNEAKINILGVDKKLIEEYTEVSEQVARNMAERVKELMNTEYSIATTGYADISGFGTDENPPGTIYVAISSPEGTIVEKLQLDGMRNRNIYKASMEGFDMLLKVLRSQNPE